MATIEARITKVEHDVGTGWYTITTDHGSVKRLQTKMDPKAREAAALRQSGEVALIRYSHKQRHDESSGRTYNNYYYEQAATSPPGSNGASGIDGIDTIASQQQAGGGSGGYRKTDPGDAWRMAKSTGAKLAVETLPLMPTEQRDFETQKRIASAWAAWIFQEDGPALPADVGFGSRTSGAPGAYAEPEPGERSYELPPPSDDDIPF